MALIQTKPRPAGQPTHAVQFLGDPSVHKDIFLDSEKDGIKKYRLRTTEDRGSQAIVEGCWIMGSGSVASVIMPDTFERYWQVVK